MSKIKKKRGRPKLKKPIDPDYMDVNQVAKYLKISASHVYTLTSNRKIPHIKFLGKKLLFDKSRIQEWLKSKEVRTRR